MFDAFLGGDEADFGSCHHAEADLDGVGSAVTAELRGETAATEFSYDSGEDEEGSEDEHIPVYPGEIGRDADVAEEDRDEEHIRQDVGLAVDVA